MFYERYADGHQEGIKYVGAGSGSSCSLELELSSCARDGGERSRLRSSCQEGAISRRSLLKLAQAPHSPARLSCQHMRAQRPGKLHEGGELHLRLQANHQKNTATEAQPSKKQQQVPAGLRLLLRVLVPVAQLRGQTGPNRRGIDGHRGQLLRPHTGLLVLLFPLAWVCSVGVPYRFARMDAPWICAQRAPARGSRWRSAQFSLGRPAPFKRMIPAESW